MVKVAYFCPPSDGGAYTLFERMRAPLGDHGYDLHCVGINNGVISQDFRLKQQVDGVEIWEVPAEPSRATGQVIKRLTAEDYRIAMTMPLDHLVTANLPCYLPTEIACIVKTPMMSRAVYARASQTAKFTDKIVAVSHRLESDLIRRYGVEPGKVKRIYNGVDVDHFANRGRKPSPSGQLRVLYLGRLSDLDKGVFLLPEIMQRVRRKAGGVVMDVVGEGNDEPALRQRISAAGLDDCIRLKGFCPLSQVPALLCQYDCMAMPSRMEACGWSLLEAMATGCVPVAHDIWGSIGMIIEDGISGFLVPVGNTRCFADRLIQLSQDQALRLRMGEAARSRVRQEYSLHRMVREYAAVMNESLSASAHRHAPLPLEHYTIPSTMKRTWRSYLPKPIKRIARQWVVRMGLPA